MGLINKSRLLLFVYSLEKFVIGFEKILRKFLDVFGIKLAPLFVPWSRRLQTLAAFVWITLWIDGLIAYVILVMLIRSDYYVFPLLYFANMLKFMNISQKGGNRKSWYRKCAFFQYLRDYFPIKLVKTTDLDPGKNYMGIAYPHGVMTAGCFTCFGSDACGFETMFSGLTSYMLTIKDSFAVPFSRELFLWSGLCDVSAESIDYLTNPRNGNGKFVVINAGGTAESLNSHAFTGEHRIILKNRKGFIKAAMKHGTSLVPIFNFGEIDIFHQVNNPKGSILRTCQDWLRKRIEYAPMLFYGRGFFQYTFGIIPFRRPITLVVGNPIEVAQNIDPTQDEIESLHQKFTQKLTELFEDGKHKYIAEPEKAVLIIE